MTSKRHIKRRADKKALKEAKKKTNQAMKELASVPDKCSKCSVSFDPKNDFHLDSWMIRVTEEGVRMLCDICKADV